jgi:hypothetical protein
MRPGFGGSGASISTNYPEIWAAQQKVIDDDQERRVKTWGQIDQTLVEVRQKLEAKYKMRF